jgi:hypothetical protein
MCDSLPLSISCRYNNFKIEYHKKFEDNYFRVSKSNGTKNIVDWLNDCWLIFVDWLMGFLIDWLIGWLIDCMIDRIINWFIV